MAAASSTARRLSSSDGAAAGLVGGGKQAGAAIARHGQAGGADHVAGLLDARGLHDVAPRRDAGDAGAHAALDELLQGPRLHRRGVDGEQRAVLGEIAHQCTPRVAMTSFMRCDASSGSASSPAASARRNSSAEMQGRARALLAGDHGEMILQAVEIGHEHHAGLVEAGRRLEDVARQRHRRRQDFVERRDIAAGERAERGGRGRRDGVEDAEQRVGIALRVARDQFGVVEVVAGEHADALRQAAPHGDFLVLVEQRDFDAVDLGRVRRDDVDRDLHRLHVVLVAPIAVERRIEHLAEPMDDHRLLHLIEDAGIDLGVIVRRARRLHQRAARHQDDAAAELFHRGALFFVGADHVVDRHVRARRQMIGAGAGADQRAGEILGGVEAPPDQLQRVRPVHAHAALRGVHRLGDAKAERPQMTAERDGGVPVDRGIEPRLAVGQRIGHHMRGRIGDAAERLVRFRKLLRRPRGVGRDRAAGGREI